MDDYEYIIIAQLDSGWVLYNAAGFTLWKELVYTNLSHPDSDYVGPGMIIAIPPFDQDVERIRSISDLSKLLVGEL